MDEGKVADTTRETLGYEIVIRFFPGSGREAHDLFTRLGWPDEQVAWMRLDRVVVPQGEERVREAGRSRGEA
jgi:transposase